MNKYYIYKYVANDEIVYIGQSSNLENRIKQHKNDKLKNIQAIIYYFECNNKIEATYWEYNLINKYHPKYNVVLKNQNINIEIQEPNWIFYKKNKIITNIQNKYKSRYTTAQKKATEKYLNEKVEEIKFRVPKGEKEKIKTFAYNHGKSVNQFIYDCVITTIKNSKEK